MPPGAAAVGTPTLPPTWPSIVFSVVDLSLTPQPSPRATLKTSLLTAVSLMPKVRHSLLDLNGTQG